MSTATPVAATTPDKPSTRSSAKRVEGGYVVVVEARNTGGTTAAQLEVQGELLSGGRVLDVDGFVIDYLPPDSVRRGGLMSAAFGRWPQIWTPMPGPRGWG